MPWEKAEPQVVGLSAPQLQVLKDTLASRRTTAFLVVRHGRIAFEWYGPGHGPGRRQPTASLAKSLVGGMALAVALSDERLDLDDPAWKYVPGWKDDSLKSKITIRHLASHSSGLPHGRDGELKGWREAFWRRQPHLFAAVLEEAPVVFEPGTRYLYSGPAFGALSYVVTAAIQSGPETDIESLLRRRIMEPLDVPRSAWSIGYDTSFDLDGMKLYASWSGGSYTARAVARVGQVMLQKGRWGEEQLVDSLWVERIVSYGGTPLPPGVPPGHSHPAPALCWWSNMSSAWPAVPRDAFAGIGAGGKVLLVIPSLDLVVVRLGGALGRSSWGPDLWQELNEVLFTSLMAAVIDSP